MVLDLIQEQLFHIRVEDLAKNVIIFGADMSSSAHVNNKRRTILVPGKDFIQGIDNTTI